MDDRSHMRVRHGPSSGVMQDAPTTGRRAYGRHPYGVLLVVLGLLADSSAGLMILVNHDGWGLLVHVPAALGWALGISVLNGRLPWRAPGAAQADPAYLNKWLLTSVLLGLVLFPGLGPLGCTVGFGLSHLLDRRLQQDAGVGDQLEAPDLAVHLDQRFDQRGDPLRDLQIQPLSNGLAERASDVVLEAG